MDRQTETDGEGDRDTETERDRESKKFILKMSYTIVKASKSEIHRIIQQAEISNRISMLQF